MNLLSFFTNCCTGTRIRNLRVTLIKAEIQGCPSGLTAVRLNLRGPSARKDVCTAISLVQDKVVRWSELVSVYTAMTVCGSSGSCEAEDVVLHVFGDAMFKFADVGMSSLMRMGTVKFDIAEFLQPDAAHVQLPCKRTLVLPVFITGAGAAGNITVKMTVVVDEATAPKVVIPRTPRRKKAEKKASILTAMEGRQPAPIGVATPQLTPRTARTELSQAYMSYLSFQTTSFTSQLAAAQSRFNQLNFSFNSNFQLADESISPFKRTDGPASSAVWQAYTPASRHHSSMPANQVQSIMEAAPWEEASSTGSGSAQQQQISSGANVAHQATSEAETSFASTSSTLSFPDASLHKDLTMVHLPRVNTRCSLDKLAQPPQNGRVNIAAQAV